MASLSTSDVLSVFKPELQNGWSIANAIRNSDPLLKQYIPLASEDNITDVANGVLSFDAVQNSWVAGLINRIGLVLVEHANLTNPLAPFKKGMMAPGFSVEEIFADVVKGKKYDPARSGLGLLDIARPNVHVLYHQQNRQDMYEASISTDQLQNAFTSWNSLTDLVTTIANTLYNSNNVDEFKYMKLLFSKFYSDGYFTIIKVPKVTDETSAKSFMKIVKDYSNRLTFPSDLYNSIGVTTQTPKNDQHLFLGTTADANINVDVLASAFNMDRANFAGHYHLLDDFGGAPNVMGILTDADFFRVYDTNSKMNNFYNPRGLYYTYYYHIWQILSTSRFSPTIIFIADDTENPLPKVGSVVVMPSVINVSRGTTQQFTALVKLTDQTDTTTSTDVKWSLETPGVSGTAIDADTGLLTVSSSETAASLTVIATSVATNTVVTTPADGDTPAATEEKPVTAKAVVQLL